MAPSKKTASGLPLPKSKPVKLQLDDDPPRVVGGRWLRVKVDGDAKDIAYVRIDRIAAIMSNDFGSPGSVIDYSDSRICVELYTPDQIIKILADAEFNEALEASLAKGVG